MTQQQNEKVEEIVHSESESESESEDEKCTIQPTIQKGTFQPNFDQMMDMDFTPSFAQAGITPRMFIDLTNKLTRDIEASMYGIVDALRFILSILAVLLLVSGAVNVFNGTSLACQFFTSTTPITVALFLSNMYEILFTMALGIAQLTLFTMSGTFRSRLVKYVFESTRDAFFPRPVVNCHFVNPGFIY